MTLRSRLDRLDPPKGQRSLRDMSDAELQSDLIPLLRAWLNEPDMPVELRADMSGLLAELEAEANAQDLNTGARDARIIAALQACIMRFGNSGPECRS